MSAHLSRMMISVWHSTLGFTTPGAQPAGVSIRLQVPSCGAYRVRTEAFHGLVAIRRLTLAGATMRGAVGEKFKGIPGFIFGTQLDNVTLAGDVDIDNLAGIPGARSPATVEQAPLAAPVLVKARVAANARLSAVTGGDVRIAIQPAPDVAVLALGESNEGTVRVGIDGGITRDSSASSLFRVRREVVSAAIDAKRLRLEVRARSGSGSVHITSIPAAPLARLVPR